MHAEPSSLTDCGLPGVKEIPYGVHMCHFYRGREDLVEALVPYFVAGLRNGERCIWITAAPLSAAEAKLELRAAGFAPALLGTNAPAISATAFCVGSRRGKAARTARGGFDPALARGSRPKPCARWVNPPTLSCWCGAS